MTWMDLIVAAVAAAPLGVCVALALLDGSGEGRL
jgi:hypothetical protein